MIYKDSESIRLCGCTCVCGMCVAICGVVVIRIQSSVSEKDR